MSAWAVLPVDERTILAVRLGLSFGFINLEKAVEPPRHQGTKKNNGSAAGKDRRWLLHFAGEMMMVGRASAFSSVFVANLNCRFTVRFLSSLGKLRG